MKIMITGATGFIGKAAVIHLAKAGHEITAIIRKEGSVSDLPCKNVLWDSVHESSSTLAPHLKNFDAVVHLAGEPVANSRWSKTKKNLIRSSRVESTRKIVEAIGRLPFEERPRSFICASAIGIYGDRGDEILDESSSAGKGFLSEVVVAWEEEAKKAHALGVRVVQLRTGVVLGENGGALEVMKPVVLGSGKHWMSWIHLTDMVRLLEFSMMNPQAHGPINAVAHESVSNQLFTQELSKAKQQTIPLSVPEILLRSTLGEMSHVLLDSTRVIPKIAQQLGFEFLFPTLKLALKNIYQGLQVNESRFSAVQFIPKDRAQVFDFFSKAENLEMITPPWLNFKIKSKSTVEIQEGTLIDYQLKIHGIPLYWRTRIEAWNPPEKFVDTQLKGPYSRWHHTHRFEEIPGGTLMWDEVIYKLPAGILGNTLGKPFVLKDVTSIFEYRKKKILEVFQA